MSLTPRGNSTGGCWAQRPAGPQLQPTRPLAVGHEPAAHQGPAGREDPGLGFQRECGWQAGSSGSPLPAPSPGEAKGLGTSGASPDPRPLAPPHLCGPVPSERTRAMTSFLREQVGLQPRPQVLCSPPPDFSGEKNLSEQFFAQAHQLVGHLSPALFGQHSSKKENS